MSTHPHKKEAPATTGTEVVQEILEMLEDPAPEEPEADRIVSRPDGYHWVARDGRQEFGPFPTIEEALADMSDADDEEAAPSPGEALQEAERDIGIADWIDPETGAPAEGQSPPHLEQE